MSERQSAEWMCTLDDRILEYMDRRGWTSGEIIERETVMNASKERSDERLRMLSAAGLVAPIYEGADMYELTGEGKRYLRGELDAEHVKRPNPHAV